MIDQLLFMDCLNQIKGLNGSTCTIIFLKRDNLVLKSLNAISSIKTNDPNTPNSTTIDPRGSIVTKFGVTIS
jgi:hypothetical protein